VTIPPVSGTWEFDVCVSTHELLRQGVTEATRVRVEVAAKDHCEARLIAAQMAAVVGMPTAVYDLE
jgi:hypothetical protein